MFTGIVTGTERILSLVQRGGAARIRIKPVARYGRFARGESVCVSGVCLTAVEAGRSFVADLSTETVSRTNLRELRAGDRVNLEKALRWGGRLSGHFVMGHVDGVSRVLAIRKAGRSWIYRFSIPRGFGRYVAEKGSIALDGVSLTVARRGARDFDVAVIPETRRRTTLGDLKPGESVNFEADIFARYGKAASLRLARRALRARR